MEELSKFHSRAANMTDEELVQELTEGSRVYRRWHSKERNPGQNGSEWRRQGKRRWVFWVAYQRNSGKVCPDKALMRERVGRVFALLDELIGALPVPSSHRKLLQVHLRVGRERAETWPEMSAVQLPLLVHAAVTGDEKPALPVAAACILLHLGADLFDSMLDHELPPSWHTRDSSEANLAATTLLATLRRTGH